MIRRPPRSTLFPNPTPFRSGTSATARGTGMTATQDAPSDTASEKPGTPAQPTTHQGIIDFVNEVAGMTKPDRIDRKSTRLNSSHANISYAVFCLKKKRHVIW